MGQDEQGKSAVLYLSIFLPLTNNGIGLVLLLPTSVNIFIFMFVLLY